MKFRSILILCIGVLPASIIKNAALRVLGWRILPKAKIGSNVFINLTSATIGENTVLRPFSIFRDVKIEIGNNSIIGSWNWVSAAKRLELKAGYLGVLKLGNHCSINSRHYFEVSGGVIFGNYTGVAGVRSTFITHHISLVESKQVCNLIQIGDYTIIGSNCVVVPGGTRIGKRNLFAMGSVIAAGDYADDSLFAGVPAIFKKKITGKHFERDIGAVQ